MSAQYSNGEAAHELFRRTTWPTSVSLYMNTQNRQGSRNNMRAGGAEDLLLRTTISFAPLSYTTR